MVTKQDIDNILTQVNAILQKLDDRVAKLETTVKGTTPKNIKVKL
tara:strand:+ start:870 stop:1004 length:135 start_codon:yes stop_codon:yes gene_type:complete